MLLCEISKPRFVLLSHIWAWVLTYPFLNLESLILRMTRMTRIKNLKTLINLIF